MPLGRGARGGARAAARQGDGLDPATRTGAAPARSSPTRCSTRLRWRRWGAWATSSVPGPGRGADQGVGGLADRAGGIPQGLGRGPGGLSSKHVLALVNRGGGTTADLLDLAREVRDGVRGRPASSSCRSRCSSGSRCSRLRGLAGGWSRRDPREPAMAGPAAPDALRYGTARGRWVLLATVLGSGMALLDAHRGERRPAGARRGPRRRLRRPAVDRQRLHARPGRADPARRVARGPLRPAAGLRGRHGLVRRRLAALRARARRRGARGRARAAGGRGALLTPGSLAILPGALPPGGPGPGDRRLVRPRRGRRRASGRSRRLARPAVAGGSSSSSTCRSPCSSCGGAAARARDADDTATAPGPRRGGARRARPGRHDVRAHRAGEHGRRAVLAAGGAGCWRWRRSSSSSVAARHPMLPVGVFAARQFPRPTW